MHYRSADFGFDVIGTVDEFTSLFPAARVRHLPGGTVTVSGGEDFMVVVPAYMG